MRDVEILARSLTRWVRMLTCKYMKVLLWWHFVSNKLHSNLTKSSHQKLSTKSSEMLKCPCKTVEGTEIEDYNVLFLWFSVAVHLTLSQHLSLLFVNVTELKRIGDIFVFIPLWCCHKEVASFLTLSFHGKWPEKLNRNELKCYFTVPLSASRERHCANA